MKILKEHSVNRFEAADSEDQNELQEMQQSLYHDISTSGTDSCRGGTDLENPYKAVGTHLIDSNITMEESVDPRDQVLADAAKACKDDPVLRKEIEKANTEQEEMM